MNSDELIEHNILDITIAEGNQFLDKYLYEKTAEYFKGIWKDCKISGTTI